MSLLQRLAALNRSGRLAKPLQFAKVKQLAAEAGEEAVLQSLAELEDKAEEVSDPTEFLRSSVSAPGLEAEEDSGLAGTRQSVSTRGPGHFPASRTSRGVVSKRLHHLNSSGRLCSAIDLARVEAPLASLGMARAMTILQAVEDTAEDIKDPTVYIRTAVQSAGGVVPEEEEQVDEEVEAEGLDWYEQAAPAMEQDVEDDQEEIEVEVAEPEPRRPKGKGKGKNKSSASWVKSEHAQDTVRSAPWRQVKEEGGWKPWFAKTEELTESDRISRRVDWLNRNGGIASPIDLDGVLPLLDSLGFRQSMRILRRLEEAKAEVSDPNEFIRDLVGRSGWVWSKPDVIDDDLKVAKRVAWLNEFGCLSKPIEWDQVADALDGLRVPHAMVVLRELEMQGKKIADPTEYIKKTVGLAGEDEIKMPPPAAEDSAVRRHAEELNNSGTLAAPIDIETVGADLERLDEDDAMQLLDEVAAKGESCKDPTGYIKFKLKAKLVSLGSSIESLNKPVDATTKLVKRIEWLNDYGGLLQDIDYSRVTPALEKAGLDNAMTILKELEDQCQGIEDPTNFILSRASISSRGKRAAPSRPAVGIAAPATPPQEESMTSSGSASSQMKVLNDVMNFIKRSPNVKRQVRISEIAGALDALGVQKAMRILREMKENGLGLDDPVSYIKAAAQRANPKAFVKREVDDEGGYAAAAVGGDPGVEGVDDVTKLTSRLNWLNQFAGLAKKITVDEVVGALYCLGVPQSMSILRGLQEKGASAGDPTCYIKQAIQRANKASVLGEVKDEEDEEYEDEVDAEEEEAWGVFEDQALEDEYEVDEMEEEEETAGAEPDAMEEWDEEQEEVDVGGGAGEDFEEIEEEAFEEPPAKKQRQNNGSARAAAAAAGREAAAKQVAKRNAPKRVVGSVTGYSKLVPVRKNYTHVGAVKEEMAEVKEEASGMKSGSSMPVTPQEKLVQVRNYAKKNNLYLDDNCLKQLSRLPFYRAKDMIEDVLLGGRNRKGVANPSKYLSLGVQKMAVGLGVEQGIAMELAVSLGVVLNNDMLDELACIPRKESQTIIRELSSNPEVRGNPLAFIRAEVLKCRAQMDARPFGAS
eukprot:TRINITY_DN5494_c0_g3_i1.p1 TRINITY_DN5494_c0_g3~~TRINITY_DN5494_c0_g3_i1.p1  ORF type:complete len:1090 (+),score=311.08 TRINITY_DN5494_c0_g3_i1:70-3339(+)